MSAKTFDEAEAVVRLLQSRRTTDPTRNNLLGLGVQNFQGITEPQFMSFANVTLIYGPNSAGKSAFLDLLDGLRATVETAGLPNFAKLQRFVNRHRGARALGRYAGDSDSMQFWIAVQPSQRFVPLSDIDEAYDFALRKFLLRHPFVVEHELQSDRLAGLYWFQSAKVWMGSSEEHPLLEIRRLRPEKEDDGLGLDFEIRAWSLHSDFPRLGKAWTDGRFSKGRHDVSDDLVDDFGEQKDGWLVLGPVDLHNHICRGSDSYCRFRGELEDGPRTEGEKATLEFLLAVFRFAFTVAADATRHVASPAVRPVPTGRDATSILVTDTRSTGFEGREVTGFDETHFTPWDWLAQDACFGSSREYEGLLDYVNRIAAKESMLGLGYQVVAEVHPLRPDGGARFVTTTTAGRVTTGTGAPRPLTGEELKEHLRSTAAGFLVRTSVQDDNAVCLGVDEVGTGVSQVIPVLVALHPGFSTSVVQQPELHLHPRLQSAMADVLLDRLQHCPEGLTIVESHSEHLLLRLLRRLRDTSRNEGSTIRLPLTRDKLIVFYADKREDGGTELRELRVSNDGEFLDRWPHGFFTDRDEDLDAFL